jgi:hypothetical protein
MITAQEARAATKAAQIAFFQQAHIVDMLKKIDKNIRAATEDGRFKFDLQGDDAVNFLGAITARELALITDYLQTEPLSYRVLTAGGKGRSWFAVSWEQHASEDTKYND